MPRLDYKGMRVNLAQLETYARDNANNWLRLDPKGDFEVCRYRLMFQGRVRTLAVYRNLKGEHYVRILLIGINGDEARKVNLDFFREVKGAMKWQNPRWTDDE